MKTILYNQFLQKAMQNAREHDTPISGCFELTPLCNLDCKMCYIHLSDPTVRNRMLSGSQWTSLMEQAIGHGMVNALLTGGEAMTHPDFREIYLYLINQGICTRIKTNGLLLNRDMIELLTEYPPDHMDVSLYGCDAESCLAVTGHDVFETINANIRAAIAAGLHLRLMITPSAYMLPWVDRIMEYAKSLGADAVRLNALLMEPNQGTGRHLEDFGLSIEENTRIHLKYLTLFPRPPKKMTEEESEFMGTIPETESYILPKGLYCNAGRTTFAINWDGTMGPCLNFPREVICADVRNIGFDAAWQQVNQGVKDYVVPSECRTCSYNTRCHYCPNQHGALAAKHLCNGNTCTWLKRLTDLAEEYRKNRH